MKKRTMILVIAGCSILICIFTLAFFILGASIFGKAVDEEFRPLNIVPTTDYYETPEKDQQPSSEQLKGLSYITALAVGYTDDADPEYDGIAIDISYYDEKSEPFTFSSTPVTVQIEIFAYHDMLDTFEIAKAEKIYQGTVSIDHSMRLGEMFGNYVRIPYDEIDTDTNIFVEFGTIVVTINTPVGEFSDTTDLVPLYPSSK